MQTLNSVLFILLIIVLFVSCKNDLKKEFYKQPFKKETSIIEKKSSFRKVLTWHNNTTFEITITKGEESILHFTLQPKGLEISNRKISFEIDGMVENAEIVDLNADGFPEVLVYKTTTGGRSYGTVIGFSVNNGKSISQISFPDITENHEASIGYMGHDKFTIVESTLVQKFPIYKTGDSDSSPTGGTRQIQYKLKNGEASRLFVIDKILEY